MRPVFHHLLLLAALTIACQDGGSGDDYSIYPDHPAREERFSGTVSFSLEQLWTVGAPDGPDSLVFGFVNDAALTTAGGALVADGRLGRISVFDSTGAFVRHIGRPGQGPGELVSPYSIAAIDGYAVVLDERTGRISVFDSAGTFIRQFPMPTMLPRWLDAGPQGTILVTSSPDSSIVIRLAMNGDRISEHIRTPAITRRLQGNYNPEPGPTCTPGPGSFVYANPWRSELARVAVDRDSLLWLRRFESDVIRPHRNTEDADTPAELGAAVLGVVCDESRIIVGYIELATGLLRYDILDATGAPIGRLEFPRDEAPYPGYPAGLAGSRLLTYSSRPYPRVMMFTIRPRAGAEAGE